MGTVTVALRDSIVGRTGDIKAVTETRTMPVPETEIEHEVVITRTGGNTMAAMAGSTG